MKINSDQLPGRMADTIAALFIFLFIYAATSKLIDFKQFRIQLSLSAVLTPYAGKLAWAVPAVELMICGLLFCQSTRLWGLVLSFALMNLFTAYIFAVTRFSEQIPCSCGGILEKMSWNQHLLFNSVFALLGFAGIILYAKSHQFFIAINRHSRKPV